MSQKHSSPLRGFERRSFKWLATMMYRIRNLAEVAVVHTDTAQANVCAKQVLTFNEQTRTARCNENNTGNRMIVEGSKTSLH